MPAPAIYPSQHNHPESTVEKGARLYTFALTPTDSIMLEALNHQRFEIPF